MQILDTFFIEIKKLKYGKQNRFRGSECKPVYSYSLNECFSLLLNYSVYFVPIIWKSYQFFRWPISCIIWQERKEKNINTWFRFFNNYGIKEIPTANLKKWGIALVWHRHIQSSLLWIQSENQFRNSQRASASIWQWSWIENASKINSNSWMFANFGRIVLCVCSCSTKMKLLKGQTYSYAW